MRKEFMKTVFFAVFLIVAVLASKKIVFAQDETVTITINMDGHGRNLVFKYPKGESISGKDVLDKINLGGIQRDLEDYYLLGWGDMPSYDSADDFVENGFLFDDKYSIVASYDKKIYTVWLKKIKEVELTGIQPLCGISTATEEDDESYDLYTQTNRPKMEITGSNVSELMHIPYGIEGIWTDTSYDIKELYEQGVDPLPYIGTFEGGETYHFFYSICPKWGYTFDLNPDKTLVNVKGATLNNYFVYNQYDNIWPGDQYFTWLEISADITADHNWDAGTVTKEPTETSEGTKTYKCSGCDATKTEAIPKLDNVAITINMDGNGQNVTFTYPRNEKISGKDILDEITSAGIQKDMEDYYLLGWGDKASYDSADDFVKNGYRFTEDSSITISEDTELYAVWLKKIKKVVLTSEQLLCGLSTATEKKGEYYDYYTQTNCPKMEITGGDMSELMQNPYGIKGIWTDTAYNIKEMYEQGENPLPYIGSFEGGETYHFLYFICPKWGYTFDLNPDKTVVNVKGATLNNYFVDNHYDDIWPGDEYFTWLEISADITADHNWDTDYTIDKPATCIAEGSKSIHCSVCDTMNETTITPIGKTGHSYGEWKTVKEATTTSTGLKERNCKYCGVAEQEEISRIAPPTPTVPTVIPAEISPSNPVAAASVYKQITLAKSDADPKGSVFNLLQAKGVAKSNTSLKISWTKVPGAKSYVVYGNKCGAGNPFKKITTITGTSYTQKKLGKGTYYKYLIVAVNGDKALSTSKTIHVATKGGKVGNSKSVTTKAKNNKVSLKRGKTFKLGAKAIAQSKKLKVKKHRAIAYESSNKKIATVSGKGVIKAVGKGTCYVFAYAQNGVCKKVKVTVK